MLKAQRNAPEERNEYQIKMEGRSEEERKFFSYHRCFPEEVQGDDRRITQQFTVGGLRTTIFLERAK